MKNRKADALKILLCLFFLIAVIYPIVCMLLKMKDVDVIMIWTSARFLTALKNSVILSVAATSISVSLAFALAWCIERSNIKLKNILKVIVAFPMLIPSISHGMGLIILFGANGVITNIIDTEWNIYGEAGIIIGSVMYSFPVAFIMIADVLKYEEGNAYQAAEVLGIPRWSQFIRITGAYMRKPMISVIFATFTLIVTDYGVPLFVGGKCITLPVVMYQDVIGQLDFGKGSAIGVVLLLPAVLAFVMDTLSQDIGKSNSVQMKYRIRKNVLRDIFCYIYCILMALVVILPIITFAVLAFVKKYPVDLSLTVEHINRTFGMSGGRYLFNSILIALFVAVLGIVMGFANAYLIVRMKSKASYLLHLLSIVSLAIPGVVLGLSYVIAFKQWPIYGTFVIIVMVNLIHFFSSPYLMMYNTLGKMNGSLEAVGKTLGISRWYIIKDVIIPQAKDTIMEMFSYFFVNCMMTISAVSFLVTLKTKTISLMITQFEAQMMIECSAFVSLVILAVNLFMKYILHLVQHKSKQKEWMQ